MAIHLVVGVGLLEQSNKRSRRSMKKKMEEACHSLAYPKGGQGNEAGVGGWCRYRYLFLSFLVKGDDSWFSAGHVVTRSPSMSPNGPVDMEPRDPWMLI